MGFPFRLFRYASLARVADRRQGDFAGSRSLIDREAIEQAVAARRAQVGLRAAAVLPARGMRRVPRTSDLVVGQTFAVSMAEHGGSLRAARPILAGVVLAVRKSGAVRLRTRQHVMAVGLVAAAIVDLALFRERRLFGEMVGAVQFGYVLRDHDTFGVLPRAFSDAVARIDGTRALRGQVGVPGFRASPHGGRELLAMPVSAGKSA